MNNMALPLVANPFDTEKNYMDELNKDEVVVKTNDDGTEMICPRLYGLWRLAHKYRGGVKEQYSTIMCVPTKENKIAAVTVQYIFGDGTTFTGSADANTSAHKKPFSDHLVAIAESKADSRALRRAFNITNVAAEEIGMIGPNVDNSPITDAQLHGIKSMQDRTKLTELQVLALIKSSKESITDLTNSEGRSAMKALNRYKPK